MKKKTTRLISSLFMKSRRILSILLAAVMVLALIPGFAQKAYAKSGLSEITGSASLDTFLVEGGTLADPGPLTTPIVLNVGFHYSEESKWQRFNGSSWENIPDNTTVEAGNQYRLAACIMVSDEDFENYDPASSISVSIDGQNWETGPVTTGSNYFKFMAYSPAYSIETESSLFSTQPIDVAVNINNNPTISWGLKYTPDNPVIIQYLDGDEWKYLDAANSTTLESMILDARSTPEKLTCRLKAYYDLVNKTSFYAISDTFEVSWHGKYTITVINGKAYENTSTQPEITESLSDHVVILKADTIEGKEFEKWIITGATVTDETASFTYMTMPKNDVTAEATYVDSGSGSGGMFTIQPQDAILPNGEVYNAKWAMNFTPASVQVQMWHTGNEEWVLSQAGNEDGASIGPDWDMTRKYRVLAYNDGEPVYSNEFTVTWSDSAVTTHTVTFEPGEGSGTPFTQTVNAGEKLTLPSCSFTPPENKVFDKWDKGDPSEQIDVSGDMTVTALWKDATVTTYPVWVGEKQVDENNKDNILGDGTVSYTPGEGAGTLTITGTPAITGLHENALIYADGIDLTINAASGLTLNSTGSGVYVNGDVTINGDASINTTGISINCRGDVTITGSLTATAGGNYTVFSNGNISIGGNAELKNTYLGGYGLCAPNGGITVDGDITVNAPAYALYAGSGTIRINGDANLNTSRNPINCSGDVTITGSLTATAEGNYTVFSNGNISIGGNAELKNTYLGGYGLCAPNGGITVDGDITVNAPAYALYAGSGTIRINGDANLNTSRNPINCSGDVTITGSLTATAEGNYTVFSNGNISIGGNAELKNTYLGGYGLCAPYGKITMTSGVWDITAGNYAIYAKNGIEIPSTHEVTTPTGGKIAQVTEGSNTFYTVTEADGTTVAKHAIIEPKAALTYTVTFDANGGTGSMADVTGISGEYTLPANGFTAPEGKQFKAWSVNGSEKAVGDKITVNANTTVTAIWEAIEYNVTVTGGTASIGASTPITKATMGTTVTLTAGAAPSGQMFDKWVVNGVVVADANSATTTFTMPAGNVTAQATYKDIPVVTYTVSFDANGGTGNMADATGISGEYTLPANGFTAPEGKQFKAWSVNGSEKAVGDKITVTANTTVTAVWEDIPAGHTCDIKPVAKVEPSCTEGGKEAYYKCEGCGKFYEDALGAKEITDLAAWGNLDKLGHTESGWKSDKDNHWKECTVAGCGVIIENSKAAHKDDNNDGKCDTCEYNVGTTTTKPEDTNKPSDDVQSPQTGDNSMMWLWVALLFVSGFGVVATTVYGKKKSSAK